MEPIAAPHVARCWPAALQALAPTIALGAEHTPESVYRDALEGRAVLWRNPHAYAVTTWRDTPRGRTAHVIVGGQQPALWIDQAQTAWMAWARGIGCNQIRMTGRPGWQRLIPDAERAVMLRHML